MTWLGPRIEPITSPTPGGCATCYAKDAGYDMLKVTNFVLNIDAMYCLILINSTIQLQNTPINNNENKDVYVRSDMQIYVQILKILRYIYETF